MLSDLISSFFISIAVSISNLDDSIFLSDMLLELIVLSRSSKYVKIVEIWFSWSASFDKTIIVVSFISLVYSERRSASELRINSSFQILFDYFCCFYLNCFSYSFFLSNIISDLAYIYWSEVWRFVFYTNGEGDIIILCI